MNVSSSTNDSPVKPKEIPSFTKEQPSSLFNKEPPADVIYLSLFWFLIHMISKQVNLCLVEKGNHL